MMKQGTHHVRRHLQNVTHDTHQALHNDPVLRQLTNPALTAAAYGAALAVFAAFFETIERSRILCGAPDQFSVQRECDALAMDLGTVPVRRHDLNIAKRSACLGALYVAHGASFGRNTFRKNVTTRLADHPHHFVQLGVDASKWGALLMALDVEGQLAVNRTDIQNGAIGAFACMQDIARGMHPVLATA